MSRGHLRRGSPQINSQKSLSPASFPDSSSSLSRRSWHAMVMAVRRRRIAARQEGAAPQRREAERMQTVPTVLCQPLPRLHGAAGERWRARQDGGMVRKAQHTVVVTMWAHTRDHGGGGDSRRLGTLRGSYSQ